MIRRATSGVRRLVLMFGLKAFLGDSAIERRAQCYKDPVERLRYLRRAAAAREKPQRARWIACLVLALATICLRSDAIDRQTPVGHSRAAVAVSATFPVPNVLAGRAEHPIRSLQQRPAH